jgi:hypothetical protein
LQSYLDKSSADLKAKGKDASAKDLTFADWDPLKDYTPGG